MYACTLQNTVGSFPSYKVQGGLRFDALEPPQLVHKHPACLASLFQVCGIVLPVVCAGVLPLPDTLSSGADV